MKTIVEKTNRNKLFTQSKEYEKAIDTFYKIDELLHTFEWESLVYTELDQEDATKFNRFQIFAKEQHLLFSKWKRDIDNKIIESNKCT